MLTLGTGNNTTWQIALEYGYLISSSYSSNLFTLLSIHKVLLVVLVIGTNHVPLNDESITPHL